jgi:hypothetical protein
MVLVAEGSDIDVIRLLKYRGIPKRGLFESWEHYVRRVVDRENVLKELKYLGQTPYRDVSEAVFEGSISFLTAIPATSIPEKNLYNPNKN